MNSARRSLIRLVLALTLPISCGALAAAPQRETFALDAQASGVVETISNIANLTVVSKDANDLKAEYRAGFVQGKLQGRTIISARDNSWDHAYLLDPNHNFPKQHGPTQAELFRDFMSNHHGLRFRAYFTMKFPDRMVKRGKPGA